MQNRAFHYDIHHNTVADYQNAKHEHELIRRAEGFLHLDAAHAPIGGDMAWSTAMPNAFALRGGSYRLRFELYAE